jgi:hypothetical protein
MSEDKTNVLEASEPSALLTIYNAHSASCGQPPSVKQTIDAPHYCGYFENDYGEQWLFMYDRPTQQATLRGGDAGWANIYPVIDGVVSGLVLSQTEQIWLSACWAAATQQPVKEVPLFEKVLAGQVLPEEILKIFKPGQQQS